MARAKAKTRKTATKKSTARKSTARKSTAKKASAKKTVKKTAKKAAPKRTTAPKKANKNKALSTSAIKEAYNKSQTYQYIAEATELSRKEIANVFDALNNLVHRHIRKTGVGEFTVPGLLKLVVRSKPATKARKGTNPFTGEQMTFKAKPARRIVKVRTLKKLKEMAE